MGASFSIPTLKVKLRAAVERSKMHIGKHSNTIKLQRKEISELLEKQKDETARIKVEAMIATKNLVIALETVQLMCELLQTRIMLIGADKTCPPDLVEAIASIIYCSKRMEIPELNEIAEQFAMKYTVEWVRPHVNNGLNRVSPRIVQCLSITPPEFALIIAELKDIATQYDLDWEPDLSSAANGAGGAAGDGSGNDGAVVNKLGAIAPIHSTGAKPAASASESAAAAPPPSAAAAAPVLTPPDVKTSKPEPPAAGAPVVLQPHPPQQPYLVPVQMVEPVMVIGAGGGFASTATLPLPMHPTPNPNPHGPFAQSAGSQPMFVDPSQHAAIGSSPDNSGSGGGVVRLQYSDHDPIPFPGTLNVLVHEGKQLAGAPKDPYVKLGIHGEPNTLKTSVNHGGGNNPAWQMEHLPFAVKGGASKLVVEAYSSKSLLSDQLCGRCFIDVEYLVRHSQPHWYPLGREGGSSSAAAGYLLLSSQYLPLNTNAPGGNSGGGGGVAVSGTTPPNPNPIVVMEHGNMQVFTPIAFGSSGGGGGGGGGKGSAAAAAPPKQRIGGADGSIELNTMKDEKAGLLSGGGGAPGGDAAYPNTTALGDPNHNPFAALASTKPVSPAAAASGNASAEGGAAGDAPPDFFATSGGSGGGGGGKPPKLDPPPADGGEPGGAGSDDDFAARLAALNK